MFPKLETWFYQQSELIPLALNHVPESRSGITCRNGSRSKSYWTKTRQGIKLVNALSEESVGQSNHGLEAKPNDRFIPEAVARRMFASLTLSSCRLS